MIANTESTQWISRSPCVTDLFRTETETMIKPMSIQIICT